ncbi:MAG: metal-dependent hydrolase, partial [Paracoccaceae bacterium]
MILAHLPSGYLVGRAFGLRKGAVMWAALAGSVFPDLDMLRFHLIDGGRVNHHYYWTHIPAVWAIVAAVTLPLIAWRARGWLPAAAAFSAGVFVHLVLDSLGGGIMWLWPSDRRLLHLIEVPPAHGHWVLSFLLHWSVLAELAIIA